MATLLGNVEQYTFELLDQSSFLQVEKIMATESMSNLFEYTVDLVCEDLRYTTDNLLGKSATLTFLEFSSSNKQRYVNGIIVEAEYKGEDKQCCYVRVTLCPRIKLLAYKSDSRIFQDMSVREIIQSVLKQANLLSTEYDFSLEEKEEKKDYCVQYQESDLAFISRLMVEQGMFYYFEHTSKNHCLRIADNIAAYNDIKGKSKLRYKPVQGYITSCDVVSEFTVCSRVRSGAVSIANYNFLNPQLELRVEQREAVDNDLMQFDYPDDFNSVRLGQTRSKRRMESMQAYKKILKGKSDCRDMQVGYRFSLNHHPNPECNREYVAIKVVHTVMQPQVKRQNAFSENGSYCNNFECIPADIVSRPQYKGSVRPVMRGIQTATVVGPSGEEIFTDKFGRVKVQFHWDRYGKHDDSSSCWLRVSHAWAGNGWGSVFIPRISQEVIVDFVEGDSDQPVITGCLYNASNMPPLTLPKNKSICGIKSKPLKQSRGSNHMLMDDTFGESRVEISNAYGHKIIQDEKEQTLNIHTKDKHILSMDDKNRSITLATSKNHRIILDDKNQRVDISTIDGHTLTLDDSSRKVSLVSKKGHRILLDDSKNCIILSDKNSKNELVLDLNSDLMTLSSKSGSINISAPEGKISLSAKELSLEASQNISIKAGKNINTEAASELSASANLVSTKSTSTHTIKGMPVQIN